MKGTVAGGNFEESHANSLLVKGLLKKSRVGTKRRASVKSGADEALERGDDGDDDDDIDEETNTDLPRCDPLGIASIRISFSILCFQCFQMSQETSYPAG